MLLDFGAQNLPCSYRIRSEAHVPARQVLIELFRIAKHAAKDCAAAHIPSRHVLIEISQVFKQKAKVSHLTDAPIRQESIARGRDTRRRRFLSIGYNGIP